MTTKADNVVKMPVSVPTFESLPASEKLKLMTYGGGEAPFPGYEYDWQVTRWVPGPGIEDAYTGVAFPEGGRAAPSPGPLYAPEVKASPGGSVFITMTNDVEQPTIVAAYASRERADRDVAMIAKATHTTLQIIELPLEA